MFSLPKIFKKNETALVVKKVEDEQSPRDEDGPLPPFMNIVFCFSPENPNESFGFVPVGARVCEVVPDSIAEKAGVQPGWYVACVDGRPLNGAVTGLRRCIPEVTTEEVKEELRTARRLQLGPNGIGQVCIAFWTRPTPFIFEYNDEHRTYEAQTVSELKKVLVAKYGSVVAAWNMLLDADGSGTLSYKEFLEACRTIGFEGSLKKVYDDLDKDGSGEISLHELDPGFSFDHTKGRCVICTLPNPCEKHGQKAQKGYLLQQRNQITVKGFVTEG